MLDAYETWFFETRDRLGAPGAIVNLAIGLNRPGGMTVGEVEPLAWQLIGFPDGAEALERTLDLSLPAPPDRPLSPDEDRLRIAYRLLLMTLADPPVETPRDVKMTLRVFYQMRRLELLKLQDRGR